MWKNNANPQQIYLVFKYVDKLSDKVINGHQEM